MKSTIKLFGIIAIVAVIGFSFASCGGGGNDITGSHTHDWNLETGLCSGCSELYYNIGDTGPGEGIIFYRIIGGFTVANIGDPCHYLEAAPSNSSSSAEWGGNGTGVLGVTTFTSSTSEDYNKIGNGFKDSVTIWLHLGSIPETGRAAQVAKEATFGGWPDWFLPSSGELNQLYLQRNLKGINITSGSFWSSSQYDTGGAWIQNFGTGSRGSDGKSASYEVRAIRAF